MNNTLMGYRRENGKVGIRNHVIILPVDDISNAACEAVARQVQGTMALPHAYGRLQYGPDLDLHFRTMIGTGSNPNVAAVIVIGIEENWSKKIAEGIAETGKPVSYFSIEGNGDFETIRQASWKAKEYVQWASELQREPIELKDLTISIKCGESDTTTGLGSCPTVSQAVDRLVDAGATVFFGETSELTGGEHLIAQRMATPELHEKFMAIYEDYVGEIESKGVDLLGSQPTQGNIAGGLSTIEEKALGNIAKTGTKEVIGVLDPAENPDNGNGLYFMDTSSAAAECITLMAAGGAVLHLFPTGQGNIIGNPIEPVVKITANPITAGTMSEHIDVDVQGLLSRQISLEEAGDKLMEVICRTVNGRLTSAEALGHREFVMTKLYRSA
ncbi:MULTISPECIES: UxaA family hydrolase [Cytobacillus]|jgi:(2R)-sulfolactate sulfo-lyase subunit beta|uniref:UxaA family hydrolase n=1 Tax=Cytobacillus TaxID=2675230 RepID=UPI0001F45AAC|nr:MULTISPECIES: UxaA family hydrolase [Cytobacillus]EFV79713.1 D-galactarate dehydratase/Altronate hydrolase-like protein [Bacillus sp. 2_A_57_CT2]MBY0157249.1 UxaA family hydrolase [Cytobacillus firmus]MCM3394806.1 UxaA family hydrolase [Cytobacillus oceanisediminis]MCM3527894.1 UxaA family hydrolase [Cytobacillus oceanisediminis]UQX56117.1 UxaA family hydrolase [Cytobacillus pseudoceanisediminis]